MSWWRWWVRGLSTALHLTYKSTRSYSRLHWHPLLLCKVSGTQKLRELGCKRLLTRLVLLNRTVCKCASTKCPVDKENRMMHTTDIDSWSSFEKHQKRVPSDLDLTLDEVLLSNKGETTESTEMEAQRSQSRGWPRFHKRCAFYEKNRDYHKNRELPLIQNGREKGLGGKVLLYLCNRTQE